MTGAVTVGLDFGTGSARVVLIDLDTGAAVAERTASYRTGVVNETTSGMRLAPQSAIQDPGDFIHAATELLEWAAYEAAGLSLEIRTIGVSATSCTVLPALRDGTPLLHTPAFGDRPHAYAKLWKHHAADIYARRINAARPDFLSRYDNRTSSEWSLAKAWQTMDEDPQLWHAAERWIDAGDWIVWQLTGAEVRSASQAGCKNHWQPDHGGYPEAGCLEAIQPGLSSWLDKLGPPEPLGTLAGPLTLEWRKATGIPPTARVAVALVDAEAAVAGSDVGKPGILVAAAGTSTCHLSLSTQPKQVPGIESTAFGAAVNGLYDYCTGQAATGDMLAWLAGFLVHHSRSTTQDVFDALNEELGRTTGPGPVSVMDWWNGCRTPLGRDDLGGIIANITTTTTPGDIYRAMLEAAAMGMRYARYLHERVEPIHEIRVTGGIARFPAIMQLYADVIGQAIRASPMVLGSARGAAVSAATGAGWEIPASVDFRDYEPQDSERYADRYRQYTRYLDCSAALPPR